MKNSQLGVTLSLASLVQDAAKVCRQYMDRDPEESRFAVVALCTSE